MVTLKKAATVAGLLGAVAGIGFVAWQIKEAQAKKVEVGPTRPILRVATITELFTAWQAGQIINPGGTIQLASGEFVTVPSIIPPEFLLPASATPTLPATVGFVPFGVSGV